LAQTTLRSTCPIFGPYLLCQTARWTMMALGMEVGLGQGHIVLDGDPAPLPQNGYRATFGHFYCGQTAGYIKMSLGMDVCISPGDFVLDGHPCSPPPPQKGRAPILGHVYCGQTAGWIRMLLGTEVGIGLRDIVFDGDPAPRPLKGHSSQFSANVPCGQTAVLNGLRCHLVWR